LHLQDLRRVVQSAVLLAHGLIATLVIKIATAPAPGSVSCASCNGAASTAEFESRGSLDESPAIPPGVSITTIPSARMPVQKRFIIVRKPPLCPIKLASPPSSRRQGSVNVSGSRNCRGIQRVGANVNAPAFDWRIE
jgi:hypothetical protein